MESGAIVESPAGRENGSAGPEKFAVWNASKGAFWLSVNGSEIDDNDLTVKFSRSGEGRESVVEGKCKALKRWEGMEEEGS
jgi:hypothetical protein